MKDDVVLVNTRWILSSYPAKYFDWSLQVADIKTETIVSRGEIVHLPSLIKALEAKKMWGVALDVFEGEKKWACFIIISSKMLLLRYIFHDQSKSGFRDDPLLGRLAEFDHVILSSHIAFYTDQVRAPHGGGGGGGGVLDQFKGRV